MNADDFAIHPATSRAILAAHAHGIVTSTSVMMNMPSFEPDAALLAEHPGLGVGVHASLNVGRPVSPPDRVPLLCATDGVLHGSFARHAALSARRDYRDQARREVEAQIERGLARGLVFDHLNSQSHLHMLPGLYGVFAGVARRFDIPHLRFTREPLRGHPRGSPSGLAKNLLLRAFARAAGRGLRMRAIGVRHSGAMTRDKLLFYLQRVEDPHVELFAHPGDPPPDIGPEYQPWVRSYLLEPARRAELLALQDEEVGRVARSRFQLVRFADVPAAEVARA